MTTVLSIICLLSTVLLAAGVLAHRGTGGGLSDLMGGGGSDAGSSAHANRNLTRLTLGICLVWVISIIALGLINS